MVHSKFHIISNKKTATPEMKEGGNNFLYPARYIFCLILLFLTISSRAVNMDSLSMKNYISIKYYNNLCCKKIKWFYKISINKPDIGKSIRD